MKTFYSYDPIACYSQLAALCGCVSVVVPRPGLTKEEWLTEPGMTYGVAYGEADIPNAMATAHLVKPYLESLEEQSVGQVVDFMAEANGFCGDGGSMSGGDR